MDKKKALLIVISLSIIISLSPAYAEQVGIVEKGKNFNRELLQIDPDGKKIYRFTTHPERILDHGQYKDYKLTENETTITLLTANSGSFIFDKLNCSYDLYNAGQISGSPKVSGISWTVKGKANSSQIWSNLNAINNANCITNIETTPTTVKITGQKSVSGQGIFEVILDYVPGKGIKETMRGYNDNPLWTNHNIGFTQKFEIPQIINFGTQTYDLSNYNQTVLNRNWIKNNEANLIKLSDKIFYDFGLGFDNLNDIKITWDGTKAFLSLNYLFVNSTVPYQTWFEVDPTFSYAAGTRKVTADAGSGSNTCSDSGHTDATGVTVTAQQTQGGGTVCRVGSFQFDISSIGTSPTVVSNLKMRYDIIASVTSASNSCDFTSMENKPSTSSDVTHYRDASGVDGTTTEYVASNTNCNTIANDYVTALGTAAEAKLLSNIQSGVGYFAVGIRQDTYPTGSGTLTQTNFGTTEIQFDYSTILPPDEVDDLSVSSITQTTAFLDWTQPPLNGGNLTNYRINYTSPYGNPLTFFANTTNTDYTMTGLTLGTQYSVRVSALTEGGYNATGNIVNFTTATYNVPAAPTLSATAESDVSIRFTSVNGTTGDFNIAWYGLRCIENNAPTWTTIITNSTVPAPRIYIYSGLDVSDIVTCQWRDGSKAGWSAWSNNATGQPVLDIIEPPRAPGSDRLVRLAEWFDSLGGVYMGMSLFPFLVMMLGLLAGPKTTHIFVIITLSFMGILHGAGYYQYPSWFWALSLLFGMVIVLARRL